MVTLSLSSGPRPAAGSTCTYVTKRGVERDLNVAGGIEIVREGIAKGTIRFSQLPE